MLVEILKKLLCPDFEDEFWSRFVFELVVRPNRLLWKDELNPRVRCAFGNVLTASLTRLRSLSSTRLRGQVSPQRWQVHEEQAVLSTREPAVVGKSKPEEQAVHGSPDVNVPNSVGSVQRGHCQHDLCQWGGQIFVMFTWQSKCHCSERNFFLWRWLW